MSLGARWLRVLVAAIPLLLAGGSTQTPPYPPSPLIAQATFDFSTHKRLALGSDNWPLTWSDDDHQYTAWGDGAGFVGNSGSGCRVGLGFARIEADKDNYTGHDVWGSPACAENLGGFNGKTRAILSLKGVFYSWVSPGSNVSGWDYQQLWKSTDKGATWTAISVKFTRQEHGIGTAAFLQFGRDNASARDEYVYVYWSEIKEYVWKVQKPGQIALSRVRVSAIEDQSRYEFFAGLDRNGNAMWGAHAVRVPVFKDPNGVMRNSAIYNPGLDRYLLITNHTESNRGNVAIFEAPEPWGPWATVMYKFGWPGNVANIPNNIFFANFSPKWWGHEGRDFVFVFTGKAKNDSWNSVEGSFVLRSASADAKPPAPPAGLRVIR